MKSTTTLSTMLLVGVLCAACDREGTTAKRSDTDPSQSPLVFEVLDQNRDGYVSKLEADDRIADYEKADANDDGQLDRQEFAAVITPAASGGTEPRAAE